MVIQVRIGDGLRETLVQPVRGQGGFQSVLRAVQAGLRGRPGSYTLALHRDDAERVVLYGERRDGGYQARIQDLLPLIREALPVPPPEPSLFSEEELNPEAVKVDR